VRVYLAGAINGKTDAECRAWRDAGAEILRNLGHEAVDPLTRDYRGREADHFYELVRDDLREIETCDAVIVKADQPSWGTAAEVFHARSIGLKVVAFDAPPNPSPWLRYCVSAFTATVDQAIAEVIR
jgi:nucleoside 2-deoxyribosyltransferase